MVLVAGFCGRFDFLDLPFLFSKFEIILMKTQKKKASLNNPGILQNLILFIVLLSTVISRGWVFQRFFTIT